MASSLASAPTSLLKNCILAMTKLPVTCATERRVRFGRKPQLVDHVVEKIKSPREAGATVPEIMRQMELGKASIYRALGSQ